MHRHGTRVAVGVLLVGLISLAIFLLTSGLPGGAVDTDPADVSRPPPPVGHAGPATLQGATDAAPPARTDAEEAAAAGEGEQSQEVLTGRVLHAETGVAVEGAWVHCIAAEDATLHAQKSISGPDGHYRIPLPAIREARVFVLGGGWYSTGLTEARQDGFDPFLLASAALDDGVHDLLVGPAACVKGRVYDEDSSPVPDAEVALHVRLGWYSPMQDTRLQTGLAQSLTIETGTDGTYRFDALVPGYRYYLRALAPGRAVVVSKRQLAKAGEERVVDLRLMPVRQMHLHVVDAETGVGLADVTVSLTLPGLHGYSGRVATTDGDGRATLGPIPTLPLNQMRPIVRKDGWLEVAHPNLEGQDAKADAHVTIRMEKGLPIRGRVLEPGDVPASGAWITATFTGTSLEYTVETDEKGEFSYPCLKPGAYTLTVRGYFGGDVQAKQSVKAGDEDVLVRLPAPLARPIRIRVLGPDGEPVPRFRYAFAWANSGSGGDDARTGPIEILPNEQKELVWVEVQASFERDGSPLPYAPASLGPLAPNSGEHVLRLGTGSTITGRVVVGEDRAAPGVTVKAYPVDRGPARGRVSGFHGLARTDDEGRFTIVGLAGGRYFLTVEAGSGFAPAPRPKVKAGRTDVLIRLEEGVTVELELVDAEDAPVKGAFVVLNAEGHGDVAAGHTNEEGRVRLEGLAEHAIHTLRVRPPHDRYDLASFAREGWTTSDVHVVAEPGGFVHGTVVDEKGKPVSGASVVALTGSKPPPRHYSGKDGAFWLGQLPAGRVRLVAKRHGAYHRTSVPVEVAVGAKDVRLVLGRSSRLALHLRDWPAGVAPRQVRLVDAADPAVTYAAFLDERFQAVFRGVVPDRTYVLFERFQRGAESFVAYAEAVAGDAKSVDVAVRPATSIAGVVTRPEDVAFVWVRVDEGGVKAKALVADDGRFVLEGLPEGEWTLVATARDAGRDLRGSARVRTGEPATIELSPVGEE